MILQALNQCYDRLASEPGSGISRPGWGKRNVSFALVIRGDGKLVNVIDLRRQGKGKARPVEMDTPKEVIRPGTGVIANYLCDNSGYVLGLDAKGKPERTARMFEEFGRTHAQIVSDSQDAGLVTVSRFLSSWRPENAPEHPLLKPKLADILEGGNLVFMLDGEDGFVHDRPAARQAWETYRHQNTGEVAMQCLVTGTVAPTARIHAKIKGVAGGQSMGTSLVSFNVTSFESYGKEQNYNAPISESAAFAYTTALNHLLASPRQRLQVGDATAIFWAERASPAENLLAALLDVPGPSEKEDQEGREVRLDPATTQLIHDILRRARDGLPVEQALKGMDPSVRFYILGLSPNQSRLSVRFWMVDDLAGLTRRVGLHYASLDIERQYPHDPEFIPLWRILKELAIQGKTENVPHILEAGLVRAALLGEAYPTALLSALMVRIRADHEVNYIRAATLKACLSRSARQQNRPLLEAAMTLNEESVDCGYRLGRLFAVLEKAQQDAIGRNTNATIRDRYFGAASASPAAVFPLLLRLAQHHIAKADFGWKSDRGIQQILSGVDNFPAQLNLKDQGLFMLGYYHQRNALYRKNNPNTNAQEKE